MSALRERWAREDAFIGPRLPSAAGGGRWECRADRQVFACTGRWWFAVPGEVAAIGPFETILDARHAPLPGRPA